MEDWCHYCRQEGKDVVARFTVNRRRVCASHYMAWRKEHPEEKLAPLSFDGPKPAPADPPVEEENKNPMPETVTSDEMQELRDQGVSVKEIAKKYGKSTAWVYQKTKSKNPKAGRIKKINKVFEIAANAQQNIHRSPVRVRTPEPFSKNTTIAELLAKLRARKAAITEAIEALEMAEKVLASSEGLL